MIKTTNISDRFRFLIDVKINQHRKFKELEIVTSVSSGTWRTCWTRKARPSSDMIEALGLLWPEHAFWLITGRCDSEHGHIAPPGVNGIEIKRETFSVLKISAKAQ